MDAASDIINNSAVWKQAIEAISQPTSAWLRPICRHMKVAAILGDCLSEDQRQSTPGLAAGTCNDQQEPLPYGPFHPLHCAASQGLLKEGHLLWQRAGNLAFDVADIINVPDASGRSPLHWAAMTGRVHFVHALLDAGAAVDCRDDEGRTALFSAAAFGALEAVHALLQRGADRDGSDERGLTPLHAAAAGGHLQVATILILARADIRREARVGATPRHVAEREGHVSMVQLLKMAASGNVVDHLGSDACGSDAQQLDRFCFPQQRVATAMVWSE